MATTSEHLISAIEDIKAAETQAARIRAEGHENALRISQKAKEEALALSRRTAEEIAAYKDARTRARHREIAARVDSMLTQAQKEAAQIRVQALDKKSIEALADFVLHD